MPSSIAVMTEHGSDAGPVTRAASHHGQPTQNDHPSRFFLDRCSVLLTPVARHGIPHGVPPFPSSVAIVNNHKISRNQMNDKTGVWDKLLATHRICGAVKTSSGPRTPFEVDYDAILWSEPFRRLVDKTQVFPLPDDDHIHNRLTHSLEVATIGRTIGNSVGMWLRDSNKVSPEQYAYIGQIVSAACLAHDIGNPPFGHFGEDSISAWVKKNACKLETKLTTGQITELKSFEGNALGFRMLVRNQQEEGGGLRLTYATLAATAKYPWSCADRYSESVHKKKYGFFEADRELFADVARATGLVADGSAWRRHPLAWLVEAADDIVNNVIDIEDGYRVGAIPFDEVANLLRTIASRNGALANNESRYEKAGRRNHLAALRSIAIGVLVGDVCESFQKNYNEILNGSHDKELIQLSDSRDVLGKIAVLKKKYCFQHPDVLAVEIAGHSVINALLDALMDAVVFNPDEPLSERMRFSFDLPQFRDDSYSKTLGVLEFVAGMTDRFAVRSYRRLIGIELPGRAG